ncbi:MAG: hypothetical protein ACTIA6_00805 [Pseudoclavibacter sp.]
MNIVGKDPRDASTFLPVDAVRVTFWDSVTNSSDQYRITCIESFDELQNWIEKNRGSREVSVRVEVDSKAIEGLNGIVHLTFAPERDWE